MVTLRAACAVLIVAAALGCAPTPVHIAQLDTGMTRAEVEAAQGKPVDVQKAGAYEALRYDPDFIVILENDRVIAFGNGKLVKYPDSDRFLIEQTSP